MRVPRGPGGRQARAPPCTPRMRRTPHGLPDPLQAQGSRTFRSFLGDGGTARCIRIASETHRTGRMAVLPAAGVRPAAPAGRRERGIMTSTAVPPVAATTPAATEAFPGWMSCVLLSDDV